MLTIALIGVLIVLAYTVSIYWIFRGEVKLDKMSYWRLPSRSAGLELPFCDTPPRYGVKRVL